MSAIAVNRWPLWRDLKTSIWSWVNGLAVGQEHMAVIARFKRGMSRSFGISFGSQNIYLCREKPKHNAPFLLTIARYKCTGTVSKCLWLQMARMEMDCNL